MLRVRENTPQDTKLKQLHCRIFSVAAFWGMNEELVGFAIGRSLPVSKMETAERYRLGILDRAWDAIYGSYVLTLGVVKRWQKRGIATVLISMFEEEAKSRSSKLLFLHVITYNDAAIQLYRKCHYQCRTLIRNFYHIRSGRQPEPNRRKWDAYLFVKWFIQDEEIREMQRTARTCLAWDQCWPFNAKYRPFTRYRSCGSRRVFMEWMHAIESSWNVPCSSSISESSSLFHRLFYRRK